MPEQKGSFDITETSNGTITWLSNLEDWARSIPSVLADGGVFMISENHPPAFRFEQ
ncbi:hypothetical protein [Bifidobacterium asteroides]|uniref:SAM-dependent methyltransferase n=1 Tax=Bifidobacterium asteroides TaxID=1684 RepID=A0A2N3RC74_9BIFI|nr:hypothetical protein [Bifidobacterium asteroides]PKV10098.1 SAM-dependent methyltransferase [Bifidobacterium asteroides]